MEIKETLKEIGLANEEVEVYLAMLKLGSSLASSISEETKINRSHIYQLLERLITKGFVSYVIKENRKYFSPINPEKIIEIIKEREQKMRNILPTLVGLTNFEKNKPVVEIFEGKEGIKTILNDILKIKKEWLAFGSSGKGQEVLSFYAEHWEEEREKLKISLRGILDSSESGIKRGKEIAQRKYTEIKYVHKEYSNPSSTWIYGERMAFVIWRKEHSFAIRIINKEISDNFRKHFEILWVNAKK
ncbi:MAG TPA: helix-turn-helix domain-containing protein [Candidatus Nanoarchaeia archaeon]|nr:helix-turn-helix domain-containing protein [Candidatus Nanoarchaeia archaeon]